MVIRLKIQDLVALARAAFVAGEWAWDQLEEREPPEPTDGKLFGIVVDNLGGAERFAEAKDAGPRITAAAIPQEIADVLKELRGGARLSIGGELQGCELSEGFTSLVYDLLTEQIEQTDGAGGVQL